MGVNRDDGKISDIDEPIQISKCTAGGCSEVATTSYWCSAHYEKIKIHYEAKVKDGSGTYFEGPPVPRE